MELTGAPGALLCDAAVEGRGVAEVVAALGLDVIRLDRPATVHPPTLTVGLFDRPRPAVAGCWAWYVGAGPVPAWMHATDGRGADTAVRALRLLGTGFAQERAGAAFRAAGRGLAAPSRVAYDAPAVLRGVDRALRPAHPVAPARRARVDRLAVLESSFAALQRCCQDNGAIAAAPARRSPHDPDYGFFWQRDAAHVATALHLLARRGPRQLRAAADRRLQAYLGFVADLGRRRTGLPGVSRYTLAGEEVGHYGDPQPDGPAATALAVLTAVADPRVALRIAGPFLQGLAEPTPGYDLWELTYGRSFHAANLARRALGLAAHRADQAGDRRAGEWRDASAQRSTGLADFQADGYLHVLRPEPAWFAATSRLDMSVVGSALLARPTTGDGPGATRAAIAPGDIGDPYLVRSADRLEAHYADRWPGRGLGRFPEDCNDGVGSTGGHPWPVTTLWAAQWHFHRGDLPAGWRHLDVVLRAAPEGLAEQIDVETGRPRGAHGLAWSHAELIVTLVLAGAAEARSAGPSRPAGLLPR